MHDEPDVPWTLIADTLAGEQGESSQADREVLARWLADQPAHQRLFATAQQVWETELSWTRPDVAVLKAHVSARIGADVDGEERTGQYVRYVRRPMEPRPLRIAHQRKGILASHPLRPKLWYMALGALTSAVLIVLGSRALHPKDAAAMTTYATGNGERAHITLSDGSHVTLDVASQLQVPADFGRHRRTLRLTGEALFAVEHQDGAPFTVVAGATTTRVLGTTFVVRCYATDTATTVAVRDGKVAVQSMVVTAQQLVEVGRAGTAQIRRATPAQFAFATGKLVIDNVRIRDAIPDLNRWYNADIRVMDPTLEDHLLEGTFSAGSIADLSTMLAFMLHVRVERDGQVLTLYPQ